MARIVLFGCAGSGKSTLARRYAARTGAALICLDAIWTPGADVTEFRRTLRALHDGEAWISDGNFAKATFDIRLPRATLIIWLDRPRRSCAWRATVRALTPGTDHKLRDLPKVLRFIAGFDRVNRPLIEEERLAHRPDVPVVRLRTDREIAAFIDGSQNTTVIPGLVPGTQDLPSGSEIMDGRHEGGHDDVVEG